MATGKKNLSFMRNLSVFFKNSMEHVEFEMTFGEQVQTDYLDLVIVRERCVPLASFPPKYLMICTPERLICPFSFKSLKVLTRYMDKAETCIIKDIGQVTDYGERREDITEMFEHPWAADNIELYLDLMDFKEVKGVYRSRFELFNYEMALLQKLGIKYSLPYSTSLSMRNRNETLETIDKLCVKMCNYRENSKMARQKYEFTDEQLTVESFKGFVESIKTEEILLNADTLDKYRYYRHEIFCRICMKVIGVPLEKSDVNVKACFGYEGKDYWKTPDFIWEDLATGEIKICEVAVTDVRPGDIMDIKATKYDNLCCGLSNFLDKPVSFCLFIFSTRNLENSILNLDEEMRNTLLEESREFFVWTNDMLQVMQEKGLEIIEEEILMLSEEQKFMYENTELLNDEILKLLKYSSRKAVPLSNSKNCKTLDYIENNSLVQNSEDEILQKIKEDVKNFDAENEYMVLFGELENAFKEKKYNKKVDMLFSSNIEDDLQEMRNQMEYYMTEGAYDRQGKKVPKMFKFPRMDYYTDVSQGHRMDSDYTQVDLLNDGTYVVNLFDQIDNDRDSNREGIGMSVYDEAVVETIMSQFSSDSSEDFKKMIKEEYKDSPFIQEVCDMRVFEEAWMVSQLYRNLAYLEGRRFLTKKKSFSVFKHFPELDMTIAVLCGTQLTKEKQIRFKVCRGKRSDLGILYSHDMTADKKPWVYSSNWLSASVSDMKHFCMLFEKCISVMSLYKDCYEERSGKGSFQEHKVMKKNMVLMPLMVMFEHKRGTSTSLQLNRYIYHSMTSCASDRMGIFHDIMSEPIRSIPESYFRQQQMKWSISLLEGAKTNWDRSLLTQTSSEKDYDEFMVPSMFDFNEKVDFNWVMNDIYLAYLFEKDSGFTGHKVKPIVGKTAKEERNYLNVRDSEEAWGEIDRMPFLEEEDRRHKFDKKFVMLMGVMMNKKLKKDPRFQAMINKSIMAVIDESMLMSSSLKKGPLNLGDFDYQYTTEKDLSFSTLLKLAEKADSNTLAKMVGFREYVTAVFSLFPKAQIGGPREILIQAYKLRLCIRILEEISRNLCSLHEKDMLTKGSEKHSFQSDNNVQFRERARYEMKKNNMSSVYLSLNSDASRWCQSFTMQGMCYFLETLGLPNDLKEYCHSVLRAMSDKVLFLPDSLKEKWDKKPMTQLEEDDDLEWVRSNSKGNYSYLRVFSGMGQGMLHFFSSLMHDAKDDLMDKIILDFCKKRMNFKVCLKTLISSDDLTKMMHLVFKYSKDVVWFISLFIFLLDSTNRLANIHVNWKKTALHLILSEFNSYFTVGKRAAIAVIKDVYTCMEIVDLSEPEDAVKKVLSSLRRGLTNGLFLGTLKVMSQLMRKWLIESYRLKTLIPSLMTKLNLKDEEFLPYNLGFLPTRNIVECCLYGPEIFLFDWRNSKELNSYYSKLYTAIDYFVGDLSKQEYEYSEPVNGKWRLLLPTKTEKRLKELKEKHSKKYNPKGEDVLMESEKRVVCKNFPKSHPGKFFSHSRLYLEGVNRKYEFSNTAQMHSMIRALSLSTEKAKLFPEFELENSPNGWAHNDVKDVYSFVSFVMSMSDENSLIYMMEQYKQIMDSAKRVQMSLDDAMESDSRRHPKMRLLRFYSQRVSDQITSDDFMDTLFSRGKPLSNRFVKSLESICRFLKVESKSFLMYPQYYIRKRFHFSKSPMQSFEMFISYYLKSQRFVTSEIVCSFPDKGSNESNLLYIYLDKMEPGMVYTLDPKRQLSERKKMFISEISLKQNEPAMKDYFEEEEDMMIKGMDSPVERAMKILYLKEKDEENLLREVICERTFFTYYYVGRDKHLFYSDLNVFAELREDSEKRKLHLKVFTINKEKSSGAKIFEYIRRDIKSHILSGWELQFVNPEIFEQEEWPFLYLNPGAEKDIKFEMEYTLKKWILWMRVGSGLFGNKVDVKIGDGEMQVYNNLSKDNCNDEVLDFMTLNQRDSSLKEVFQILSRNNWLHTKPLVKNKQVNSLALEEKKIYLKEIDVTEEVGSFMMMQTYLDMGFTVEDIEGAQLAMKSGDYGMGMIQEMVGEVEEENLPSTSELKEEETGDDHPSGLAEALDDAFKDFGEFFSEFMNKEEQADRPLMKTEPADRMYLNETIFQSIITAVQQEIEPQWINLRKYYKNCKETLKKVSPFWCVICTDIKREMEEKLEITDLNFIRLCCIAICCQIASKLPCKTPAELMYIDYDRRPASLGPMTLIPKSISKEDLTDFGNNFD